MAISGAIKNILTTNQGLVNQAKDQLKQASLNKAQEEALKRAPDISDLTQPSGVSGISNSDIIALANQETTITDLQQKATISTPLSVKKVQEVDTLYNKLKNTTTSIDSQLNSFNQQLNAISKKVDIAESLFGKINQVIEIVNPLINTLKFAVPVAANAAIAASSGPAASGAVIDRAQKARDKALGFVSEFESIIKIFTDIFDFINKQIREIKSILDPAKVVLRDTISFISNIVLQLDGFYRLFLSLLNITANEDLENAGTNIIDETPDEELGDLLSNLPDGGSIYNQNPPQKIFELLGTPPKTGYRYKNISSDDTP